MYNKVYINNSKMDARVNDFFKEINEIVPPVAHVRSTGDCVWQECFDDTTGYPYYWNMHTNAVTWEVPPEYQAWLDKNKATKNKNPDTSRTSTTKQVPEPLFPSVGKTTVTPTESKTISTSKSIDFEEKKVKIVPAYLVDSDHDSREGQFSSRNGSNTNSPFHSNNSKSNSRANSDTENTEDLKPTLGFSLLANYGNYSDEEDEQDEEINATDNHKPEPNKNEEVAGGHSTLFPITKPIDVTQFAQETKEKELAVETEEIDVKAFKRKRRIGVHLVNQPKREVATENTSGSTSSENLDNLKKKFGMTFVQGDTLQPTLSAVNPNAPLEGDECKARNNETDNVVETQTTLKEKLAFLSEGREPISPVQIMSIQLEILFSAWKSGNLNSAYFTSWIKDVSSDLIKLEADATPDGWNLEWDRKEKRYFYRNKATDECQWEYPQGDARQDAKAANDRGEDGHKEEDDDAMDICTTPPPTDAAGDGGNIEVTTICAEATEKDDAANSKEQESKDLSSALDSFYSDIAAIETATSAQTETKEITDESAPKDAKTVAPAVPVVKECASGEPPKKKKKVKMLHGISMKKKGVSQLVEKWKNVQKDLE